MKSFHLTPDSLLLNPDFEGYKLSLDSLPSYETPLQSCPPLQVKLDASQYSVQHLKTYGNQNCLHLNPWNQTLLYFDADGGVNQSREEDGAVSFDQVFQIPKHASGFSIPPSVTFPSPNVAVISDSHQLFFCQINAGIWAPLKFQDSTDELNSLTTEGVLLDSCLIETDKLHLVFQRVKHKPVEETEVTSDSSSVEENHTSAFCSELIWVILKVEEDSVACVSMVKFESKASADFASIDRKGKFVSIASQHPFALTFPHVEETEEQQESAPSYIWTQTTEDVTLSFLLPKEVSKADVEFSLKGSKAEIGLKNGKTLISGQLHGKIDMEGCSWTLMDSILEVTLAKNQLSVWDRVVEGDETPETRSDGGVDASTVHESLKHLTTETWNADPNPEFKAYNAQELEDCDFNSEESSVLLSFDRENLKFVHQASLSSHQLLFTLPHFEGEAPVLCLRHDVDGVVWRAEDEPTFLTKPFKHLGTLNAFGYVSASKSKRRFLTASPDFSYAVVADVNRHVYVYRQKTQLENSDLRNRKDGKRVSAIAKQQVISLNNNEDIIGLVATMPHLFILTSCLLLKVAIE